MFVRLKLALLRNGLRQSTGRKAVFVTAIVLALLFGVLQLLGLLLLRGHEHVEAVVLPVAALLALGWAVMPLFFPGGDETLDPTRLAMLPLRPRSMVVALLSASLVGIGPVFTLLLLCGAVLAVAHGTPSVVVALLALPLALLTCLALARAVATANIRLLTSRKGRDLAVLSGLLIAIGAQFLNIGMQKLAEPDGLSVLEPAAEVLRWLPPSSAVSAVHSTAEGSYAPALAQLAISAAALAGALWWWQRTLRRLMTSPDASTLPAAEEAPKPRRRVAGLAALLPAGRTGAVMERTLRYAWRDPKTKVGWASGLGVGILLPVVMAIQGNASPYQSCWAAGLLGVQLYNQFGQDSSGFWLVASTTASARDAYVELRARMLAVALVAVPYVTAITVTSAFLTGSPGMLPEVLGLALGLLGVLLATGVASSVYAPYSIPQESGKNVAPGQGSLAAISILLGMLAGAVLCAPLIAAIVWLRTTGAHELLWLVLPFGVGYGFVACVLALRLFAPRLVTRLPEVLTAVTRG
ncbi:transporter [Streptomyces oceani]|uniref:Transporter n=1 Tax=Streptomyces oceani TaxID=1075402 RepID=A0A1E7KMH0_9ACTN|nr:transporter [Streptomyces oceani]OEV05108.1 transporter [Streptomyces oceani]